MRIGVDTGGTFTDTTILLDDGRAVAGKALTTPGDLVEGILASIGDAAAALGSDLGEVVRAADVVAHASTVGINALLTGSGARVGLLTTEGFEATLPIARANKVLGLPEQDRSEATRWEKPPLLLPRRRILGIRERVDVRGEVIVPLDEDQAREQLRTLADLGVESLGISLLWSPVNPAHELQLAELAAAELPGVPVTVSHELASRIGEYERTMTVVLNAYVAPLVAEYLGRLESTLRTIGFGGVLLVMQTSGGVLQADHLARRPVDALSSGPVGGVRAAVELGRQLGHPNVVTTDVGGTSFDVGLVIDGELQFARRPMVERYALAMPVVDVVSIGTGGGSIARVDPDLGALLVGPRSAGSEPGPACYGRGGTLPTVTDAAVALGYLDQLGGALHLDPEAATEAIGRLARELGAGVEQTADDVLRVACAQMADLVRRTTVHRGNDPDAFVLYAFGGAAPQYAGRYAAELGAREVVVPGLASVFSAFGLVASDPRTRAEHELRPIDPMAALDEVDEHLSALDAVVRSQLGGEGEIVVDPRLGLRFVHQVNELQVPLTRRGGAVDAAGVAAAVEAFRSDYERLVGPGAASRSAAVELVGVAVEARTVRPPLTLASTRPAGDVALPTKERRAWFSGHWRAVPVYPGEQVPAEATIDGPAFVELPTTTLVVYPGQQAAFDAWGNARLRPAGDGSDR